MIRSTLSIDVSLVALIRGCRSKSCSNLALKILDRYERQSILKVTKMNSFCLGLPFPGTPLTFSRTRLPCSSVAPCPSWNRLCPSQSGIFEKGGCPFAKGPGRSHCSGFFEIWKKLQKITQNYGMEGVTFYVSNDTH